MQLAYSIIFSRRKKLTLTVERDRSVVVRAPEGTELDKIRSVVESRKKWIFEKTRHPQKYNDRPDPPGKELVSGESIPYLGKYYRIEVVEIGEDLRFAQRFILPRKLASKKDSAFGHWYREQAQQKILPRVQQHARNLGVSYKAIKITESKYRWGSCTPKDNLNFNWRLIKAPMFVIDYVIIHELAHLIEPNHTPRFWNIVRAQITDLDKAKAWLRKNGASLSWMCSRLRC